MATREQFKQSIDERRRRSFSTEFKQKKVREIEQKMTTIAEVSRQYEVSQTNVSRWMAKYSNKYMKGVKTIVESESDTHKLMELKAKVAELERIIGQKQVLIDFQNKMIELAEEAHGIEIKKNSEPRPLSGTGKTGNSSGAA
jgi:transposase